MNMEQIRRALMKRNLDVGKGASESTIEETEKTLGVRFPRDFRDFLRLVGWVTCPYFQIYGVGKDVPEEYDLVKNSLAERTLFEPLLHPELIPVMNDGSGSNFCLDTSKMRGDTCPVVFWDHEHEMGSSQEPEVVSSDFASWLQSQLDSLPAE